MNGAGCSYQRAGRLLFLLLPVLATSQWWRVVHEGGNDPRDTALPVPMAYQTPRRKRIHKKKISHTSELNVS